MALPNLPMIPSSMLNWGKRVSEGIQEKPPEQPTGTPLTPEEEQLIADELQDDPLFTKEENAAIRKAAKEAEEKRKKDEEDIAAADRYGEMMAETDPEKLKKNQELGYQFNPEQEKIVWKYEREKPVTRKVGDFLKGVGSAVESGATVIPVGAYKGLKYTVFDPIGAMDATPEEEAKVLEKAGQTARSFGSGVVGGLEDLVYELPKTIYKGGTPVTDWAKELVGAQTEEESYQNFLKREAARKEFAAEEEAMPERTSALLAKGAGALGDVGLLDKQFSKDLEQQIKERALTKEQMVPEVSDLGDVFAPDIPFMGRMSKLTGKVTGKVGEGALKALTGVQVGNRRIGLAPAVEAVGYGGRRLGEKINEYSAKIDRAISGSDDWIFRNAVGKTSNFLGRVSGGAETFGRLGTDIGRVVDEGIAGRKGVAERLGERSTTGRLGNVLFGDASQGLRKKIGELSPAEAAAEAEKNAEKIANRSRQGLARARAVDSAARLGQYYANAGINGAAVQVMLGLPNMETWGDVGEATGYGAGMGFAMASNPKSLFVDRVRADQRKAAEGDIGRMMEGLDETTKARLKSLSDPATFVAQLTKRKDSVQSRVDLLKDIVNSAKKRTIGNTTITPRDAQAEIDHLEGTVMPKIDSDIAAAAKTNPQTQKEIEFIINKEFMDSLGNLQAVGENSGLGGDIDVRMLGTDEISAALDEMYKAQKDSAAEIIRTLGGQETLSPEDKKLLDGAIAFEGFLESEKENLSNQRGFALTPVKDMTQDNWWQNGAPVSKPTIIVNSDELKNSRGLDIASVLRHEMFHGLLQFGEVQDMMKEYTDVLFDQYATDAEGNQIKFSDGIISDEKLRQMADKYSAKYNPLEKGMWRSMFENDADLLSAIKEEFLAEAFTQSGGATGMTSNVEDSVVETVLDYGRAQSASSTLGKIRDSLGKMGISIDDSGRSNVLESEIPSQAIALMRQFRRTLRDYNGTLNQIGQAELNAPGSIPITKIASSKALFNRYKDADFWEREAATTVTAPDGTVLSEEVLPKSAQNKLVSGEWTVKGGKLVPVDPEYSAVAPKALSKLAKGKPDGTKIVAGVRIARNTDGTPRILSKAATEAIARKRNDLIKQAIDSAPEDGTPNRLRDTGNGSYRGVISPSQLVAISKIPDIVLPTRMKVLIRKVNEMLLRNDGSRFNTEYQAALRGGGYRAMAPRFSDDVPIGFQFSKDGNFLVTTVSVTRLNNKLNAWAKEMPGRLALWNGSKYDFWADFVKVLDNQKKNIPGQTDLDGDPAIAEEKKNVINDLLNLYNKETELLNPSRTKLKPKRGQDSRDRTIVSRRLDRMLRLDENNAEKLPINYGKVIANALPQAEFNFGEPTPGTKRFYQDFEILNKASGEYAGQPIRISVQAKTAEEAEQMISQTPDYQRYNAAYRFNSIGKPYSAPDPSERMTPEDFAAMKSNAGLGPSSKALPASIFGDFYHGTNNPGDFLEDDSDFNQPRFYGYLDPVEVVYVAPEKIDAQKFGDSTLRAKIKNSNIFDPSSDEDLKKFKESALNLINERYESFDDVPFSQSDYFIGEDGSQIDSPDWRNILAQAYVDEIVRRRYDKQGGWIFTEKRADIIKDAGFDGYIAWEFGNPQIGFFPDRLWPDFKLDTDGYEEFQTIIKDGDLVKEKVPKPSGKVDFAKALPREIAGNPTFWKDLYHYTDKDSAEAISIGGFDISKSTEERLFPNTISLTTKDSWNVGDAAVLNELSAENPVIVRVSGNQREGEIGLWDFAKEDEEVSPMELGKRLVDWAQSQGHDVIVARGVPGPGKEYAVLDPSKIKVKSVSKALPQDLSQVTLDERKAKLPKYKVEHSKDPYSAENINNRITIYDSSGNEAGKMTYAIWEPTEQNEGSISIQFARVPEKYRKKGYGEALYREIAKVAQENGITEIVGETSPDARKVRNKLFPELTANWEDKEGKNEMVSIVNPSTKYLPKSEQDFYSRLQQGIAASQQKTFSPEQAKALAVKSTNQEELKWSGIDQAIDDIAKENNGKVPKQALLDYMDAAGNVQFEEVVLDETGVSQEKRKLSEQFDEINNRASAVWSDAVSKHGEDERYWPEEVLQEWHDLQDLLVEIEEKRNGIKDSGESAKYGPKGMNKVLPGGRNYREVVMTMPDERAKAQELLGQLGKRVSEEGRDYTEEESRLANELQNKMVGENQYTSSHFRNIPNYVAHYRTDDRTDSEGKEGRFIQEIQSDRHQQGRKYGYKSDIPKFDPSKLEVKKTGTEDTYSMFSVFYDGKLVAEPPYRFAKTEEQAARIGREAVEKGLTFNSMGKMPIADAPFRKDWPLQMFKRALRDAVADDKEWIGWTDGQTQADRYDLSKQVDSIKIFSDQEADKYSIWAKEKGNNNLRKIAGNVSANEMANYIGKELAEKAAKDIARSKGYSPEYSGLDLKVGGEGMKGFYDTMLPKEVGKYVDKMGGKVEQSALRIGEEHPDPVFDIPEEIKDEIAYKAERKVRRANPALDDESDDFRDAVQELQYNLSEEWAKENGAKDYKIWRINITPQMRETVLKQGQPKFLPNSEKQQQEIRAPKERGLKFLKYAEEEEERSAPLSSLMLN